MVDKLSLIFLKKNGKISLYISIHKSNKYETNQVC